MRTSLFATVLVVAVLVMSTSLLWAQAQIELQFDDQPLGVALRALQQQYGIKYSLPADLANARVTVRATVDSAAAAVQELAKAANVRAMQDPNTGTYMFQAGRATGSGVGAGAARPANNPWAGAATTGTTPTPWRPGAPSVPSAVPGVPGMAPGGAAAGALAPGQIMTAAGTLLDLKDLTLRVLETTYINPELVATLFGGTAIYDISANGGGSGSGGGGFGNIGNNNGNNNNGNNNNSFGNNNNSGSGSNNRNSNSSYNY